MKKKYIQPQTVCESQHIPLTILAASASAWSVGGKDGEDIDLSFGGSATDDDLSFGSD